MNSENPTGEKTCQSCGYFRQHYIWRQGYEAVNRGHCVHPPRTRLCRPGLRACPKWIPQDGAYLALYVPEE